MVAIRSELTHSRLDVAQASLEALAPTTSRELYLVIAGGLACHLCGLRLGIERGFDDIDASCPIHIWPVLRMANAYLNLQPIYWTISPVTIVKLLHLKKVRIYCPSTLLLFRILPSKGSCLGQQNHFQGLLSFTQATDCKLLSAELTA